jgi:hypothetical protein
MGLYVFGHLSFLLGYLIAPLLGISKRYEFEYNTVHFRTSFEELIGSALEWFWSSEFVDVIDR